MAFVGRDVMKPLSRGAVSRDPGDERPEILTGILGLRISVCMAWPLRDLEVSIVAPHAHRTRPTLLRLTLATSEGFFPPHEHNFHLISHDVGGSLLVMITGAGRAVAGRGGSPLTLVTSWQSSIVPATNALLLDTDGWAQTTKRSGRLSRNFARLLVSRSPLRKQTQ